ncbi:hypothetical protein HDA40_003669 [Hamadaea flava]|uniref:LPXTG-motif cell wall-anchored protein n=1 Tax=Hamadaea flava TaxID=1742688 RepID=A0ABV8LIC4_9ACTN|nr:hypothetical protein [Hamadaea flava]MCP2325162.1 hypothetical protein [Hamadaea flava]
MRQRLARVALAAVTAAIAGLAFASPAHAATATVPINPGNVGANGVTAADFQSHDCDDIFDFFFDVTGPEDPRFNKVTKGIIDVPGSPIDGWHFVLPDSAGDAFVSLSLTFATPDGPVTAAIPGGGEDDDPYWGVLGAAGGKSNKHAYLLTFSGWTLKGGTAVIQRADGKTYAQDMFNLSHVCAGTPTTGTPTPGSSESPKPGESGTPTPGTSESTQPGGGEQTPSPSTSSTGGLPVTGVAWGATVLTAVGLIAAGIALVAVRRRRELTDEAS